MLADRSGIESTNAECKTAHALREIWTRELPNVTFAATIEDHGLQRQTVHAPSMRLNFWKRGGKWPKIRPKREETSSIWG